MICPEPVPSTKYNKKSQFLFVGSGTTTTYNPSNTKFFLSISIILKALKFFEFETFSKTMPQITNKAKKPGQQIPKLGIWQQIPKLKNIKVF